jgi:hypothetical protein
MLEAVMAVVVKVLLEQQILAVAVAVEITQPHPMLAHLVVLASSSFVIHNSIQPQLW